MPPAAANKITTLLRLARKRPVRARDLLRKRRGSIDALVEAARTDRIYTFMRLYLEALA